MTEQAINSDTVKTENPFHSSAVKQQLPKGQPLPVPESEKIATDKYTEIHTATANKVRAEVDNVGRRTWLFTTDKGPLSLHSYYGKELVKALPPDVEHLAGNTEAACNLRLFWKWKQVPGRKDVREITDIMRLADVTIDDQRAQAFKEIAAHYGLTDWEWKTFKPRAEDELGQDAPVIEYKAAYERYAKEMLEPKQSKRDRLKEQALAGKKASEDPYYGTPLTAEMVAQRTASMPEPPIVIKDKEDLNKVFPRDENGQPLEDKAVTAKTKEDAKLSDAIEAQAAKLKSKTRESAVMPADEWDAWILTIFGVESLTDINMADNAALEILQEEFQKKFDNQKAKSAQKSAENGANSSETPNSPDAAEKPHVAISNGNPFRPATFGASKLRMALVGPSGSGKTYTALKIATNLVPDAKVALIDTERGSASKYARLFKFDVLELRNYHPDAYIKAIKAAVDNGYNVLIIDSLSHAWNGDGGVLSIVDKKGGRFDAWKDVTPLQLKMVDTMLDAPLHIIATMRSKTEYVVETNERGKAVPRKVGLAPVQRDGMEYEFDVFGEISIDSTMSITKSRCPDLTATEYPKAGTEVAAVLSKWLMAA